jgi:hypothetical protein
MPAVTRALHQTGLPRGRRDFRTGGRHGPRLFLFVYDLLDDFLLVDVLDNGSRRFVFGRGLLFVRDSFGFRRFMFCGVSGAGFSFSEGPPRGVFLVLCAFPACITIGTKAQTSES